MGVGGNQRRHRVCVTRGNHAVQERANGRELRIEGDIVAIERVLSIGQEGDACNNPGLVLGLVEELAAEVSILAIPLVAVRMQDALLDILVSEQHVLPRREEHLSRRLSLVDLLKMLDEGPGLLDAKDQKILPAARLDLLVEPLEFLADRGAQPSRRAEGGQRAVDEEGKGLETVQKVPPLEAPEKVNNQESLDNLHHQPESFTISADVSKALVYTEGIG